MVGYLPKRRQGGQTDKEIDMNTEEVTGLLHCRQACRMGLESKTLGMYVIKGFIERNHALPREVVVLVG